MCFDSEEKRYMADVLASSDVKARYMMTDEVATIF